MQSNDKTGSVTYLNSGDWIENLTALEYTDRWNIVYYKDLAISTEQDEETIVRKLSPDIIAMQDAFEKHRKVAPFYPSPTGKLSA